LKAEEEVFYDRLKGIASARSEVRESLREHNRLERLLARLDARVMGGKAWESTLQDIENSFKSHVKEEESKIFSVARKFIKEKEAQELGQLHRKEKKQALARFVRRPTR